MRHRMFNPGGEPCENVHSQTRRMVMISPEPGFWIHCVSSTPSYVFSFADACCLVRRITQDSTSASQVSKQRQEIGTRQAGTSVRLSRGVGSR